MKTKEQLIDKFNHMSLEELEVLGAELREKAEEYTISAADAHKQADRYARKFNLHDIAADSAESWEYTAHELEQAAEETKEELNVLLAIYNIRK